MNDTAMISKDSHGTQRVAGTRISLDSVVIGFQQGQSAEEIQRNFPALSLEQVYATIAYYLGHRAEVDEYLRVMQSAWDKALAENERNPAAAAVRLRRSRAEKAGHRT